MSWCGGSTFLILDHVLCSAMCHYCLRSSPEFSHTSCYSFSLFEQAPFAPHTSFYSQCVHCFFTSVLVWVHLTMAIQCKETVAETGLPDLLQ